ncbi:MAG: class I SAM-dependent methyltransferase [Beutenbergiaceae bacterium]
MRSVFWWIYAGCYDVAWDSPITRELAQRVAVELPEVTSVADVGCGTGLSAALLTARGVRVRGVDACGAMVRRAIRAGRISTGAVRDAAETNLPAGSVDAALCANLLHLHAQPMAVLDELTRIVAPGGKIVLVTPMPGLQHGMILKADRGSGRGYLRSVIADITRQAIAVIGSFSAITVRGADEVDAQVRDAAHRSGWLLRRQGEVGGLQRYSVYEVVE